MSARSPILGWFALSVFSDAARFRVKRVIGELDLGPGGLKPPSGLACFDEPRRLDSVEMLTGDRGVSKFDVAPSIVSGMMVRRYTWGGGWKELSVKGWGAEDK